MAVIWTDQVRRGGKARIPDVAGRLLPDGLVSEIEEEGVDEPIEELRLRRGRRAALTQATGTRLLHYVTEPWEMDELMLRICDGSVYAHRDTVAEGYVTLEGGVRVGICGRAATEGERIIGVYDADSLNFRFPRIITGLGESVERWIRRERRGVLIYGPPGSGKTTVLRSLCMRLGSGNDPWRIAVVDSRGELGAGLSDSSLTVDVLRGYPRRAGVEIAVRTMNPQLVVCDELGEPNEARSILALQNCGVPFLASAHAGSVEELLRREGMLYLHRGHLFGLYVGLQREREGVRYTETPWEDVSI